MIRKSFQLIRTNTSLTTNYKIVVTSKDLLYLESFDSSAELSDNQFKHFRLNKNDYLEDKIPEFYAKLPSDLAFSTRYDNDVSQTYTDYYYQTDFLYFSGANKIEDTWYTEEFEYLAPLYIRPYDLPTNFVIMRVDDSSNFSLDQNNNFEISSLNNLNFYNEVIDKWKCVELFDLTTKSNIGKFLDKNYTKNKRFPSSPFYFDARRTEFSKWSGMDYDTGIYTEKDFYLEDTIAYDQLHFRFEKFITQGYKNNKLIFPNILNLKFLFDDTPATPDGYKKYSMNRYYGFYMESLDFVGSITSYVVPELKPGLFLINNIIVTGSTGVTWDKCDLNFHWTYPSVNPFVGDKWDDNIDYYIFLDNTDDFYRDHTVSGLYPVVKVIQNGITVWKIVSDEIMDSVWDPSGETYRSLRYHPERVNMKNCNIVYDNKFNILSGYTTDFFIDKYYDISGQTQYMYGDLYLIDIDGVYHVIKNGSGITYSDYDLNNKNDVIDKYYIQTDWAINSNKDYLEYWIVGKNTPFYQKKNTYEKNRLPNQYNIYRVKFTDIKDFDYDRVNSDYANFDYEQTAYVDTPEEKLHAIDYTDTTIPKGYKTERYGTTSQYKISNVSSEYVADDELFELTQIESPLTQKVYNQTAIDTISITGNRIQRVLTDLWRKNQTVCKWGFMGSISHSDYAYKLNNSLSVGGRYNRTTDPYYVYSQVSHKNLDYFYRIGNFYSGTLNNKQYYKFQSTNIEGDYIFDQFKNTPSDDGGFNIGAYFNTDFDYFTHFFKNKMNFLNSGQIYTRNYDKYSVFNAGDDVNSSLTLFKGLKIYIKSISNINVNRPVGLSTVIPPQITKIIYDLTKNYNGYKFSIILNDVYGTESNGIVNNKDGVIDVFHNGLNIIMNEKFKNILVIINFKVSSSSATPRLNDVSVYNEKDGLYYGLKKDGTKISGYDSNPITAYNFINSINTPEHSLTVSIQDYTPPFDYIRYYLITEYNGLTYTGCTDNITDPSSQSALPIYNSMNSIPNWNKIFSPFLIHIDYPDSILVNNKNNYTVNSYAGPDTRPLFGYSVSEPLGRIVVLQQQNKAVVGAPDSVPIGFTSTTSSTTLKQIFRFTGPYEPIFKDINVFQGGFYYYTSVTGTTLTGASYSCSAGNYLKTFNYVGSLLLPWMPQYYWENETAMCRVVYQEQQSVIVIEEEDSINQNSIFNADSTTVIGGGSVAGGGTSIGPPTPISSRIYTQVNCAPTDSFSAPHEVVTKTLFVGGFNFGVLPPDAVITKVTATVRRRSKNNDGSTKYCYDDYVTITKDYTSSDPSMISPTNFAYSPTNCPGATVLDCIWNTTFTGFTYPTDIEYYIPPSPLMGFSSITPLELSNPNFGILIRVKVKNTTSSSIVIPQIECVTICVTYTYNQIVYTYDKSIYMDSNLKFDTGLNDFGIIDEFIFSKVNENQSILKINSDKDTSMYPMIDEYGYTYSSRFVFKSPWDKEFFIRTNSSRILNYQQIATQQQTSSL